MPLGNGTLFLPVKAEIPKKIKKEAGDQVYVQLFADSSNVEIPPDLLDCLRDEPKALEAFMKLTEGEKKNIIDRIYSYKKESPVRKRLRT